VLGFDVGDSENEGFWTSFLRSLKTRGLGRVKLVMSDAHTGLKKAIGIHVPGAPGRDAGSIHMRNVLAVVPKGSPGRWWPRSSAPSSLQPDREHIEEAVP
jgi:transposase-like protein